MSGSQSLGKEFFEKKMIFAEYLDGWHSSKNFFRKKKLIFAECLDGWHSAKQPLTVIQRNSYFSLPRAAAAHGKEVFADEKFAGRKKALGK